MTKVSITHEGGPEHGPVTVKRHFAKEGSSPAFDLEDGLEVSIEAGNTIPTIAANPAA